MQHLFLDDERIPGQVTWVSLPSAQYTIVRNFEQFVNYIYEYGVPNFISFDHDLADQHYIAAEMGVEDYGQEKTGYDCAVWLVDFCDQWREKFPKYAVHSMNPIGRERIISYIENAKKYLNI